MFLFNLKYTSFFHDKRKLLINFENLGSCEKKTIK